MIAQFPTQGSGSVLHASPCRCVSAPPERSRLFEVPLGCATTSALRSVTCSAPPSPSWSVYCCQQLTQDIFSVYLAITDKSFYFYGAICEELYFPTFPRHSHQDHNRFITATLQNIVYFPSF